MRKIDQLRERVRARGAELDAAFARAAADEEDRAEAGALAAGFDAVSRDTLSRAEAEEITEERHRTGTSSD